MSECTLYVLDAPKLKTQDAASDFIAESESSTHEPNSKIGAFLDAWRAAYPAAPNRDDSIWYESLPDAMPRGPVLALVLRLATFNSIALTKLRKVAGQHKLHVFDPEGYVLYLANGKEIGIATADPVAAMKAGPATLHGVRFDGVYMTKLAVGWGYYRFTADGKAYRLSLARQAAGEVAFRQMVEGDPFVAHGKWSVDKQGICGKVKQPDGTFYFDARIEGDTLSLTSQRKDGRFRYSAIFDFVAI
jgi:hypothetical protein